MRRRLVLRPWRLLPAHIVNGLEVALGIGCIQQLATAVAGPHVASLVVSGAVCASLADVPNTLPRTAHRVGAATLLSAASALTVDLLRPYPFALGCAVALVAFVGMMTLAWGARAGAVSFTPILSMVFSMAVPPGEPALATAGWSACGGVLYLGWALLAGAACQRRYRALVLAQALAAAARLFEARAAFLLSFDIPDSDGADTIGTVPALGAWIGGEAALADRLQAARDLLFTADDSPRWRRDVAILLRLVDLRDVLLASRLDAELLGVDPTGVAMREALAQALQAIGARLDAAAFEVQHGAAPIDMRRGLAAVRGWRSAARRPSASSRPLPSQAPSDAATFLAELPIAAADVRARLVPSLLGRLRQLDADCDRVHRLLRGHDEALPLTRAQLQTFVTPEGWPLRALRPQWRRDSPVLRHAMRMALALAAAYFLALLLPWGSHPHWLVLSVAVVLRGSLGETLVRRNARVAGTLLGCLVVVALSRLAPQASIDVVFLAALGIAHAYVLQHYWLTATAASVMALLQSHLVDPRGGFAIGERVADTFLGAAMAWCFSYVLPSWERRGVADAIGRVLRSLNDYAARSLVATSSDPVLERLARRQAYDALAALAAALRRSRVEPKGVRLPMHRIAVLLDHGERLMAHLSMVRLTLERLKNDPAPPPGLDAALAAARDALARRLDLGVACPADADAAPAEGLGLLPERPASHDVMPCLERRLALIAHEAGGVRRAAEPAGR